MQSDGHRDGRDGPAGSWLPVIISVHPDEFCVLSIGIDTGCGTFAAQAPAGATRYRIQTSHSNGVLTKSVRKLVGYFLITRDDGRGVLMLAVLAAILSGAFVVAALWMAHGPS